MVKLLVMDLFLGPNSKSDSFKQLLAGLPPLDQRSVLFAVLKFLSAAHLNALDTDDALAHQSAISATISLIWSIVEENETLRNHLTTWLTSSSGAGLGDGVGIRRAVVGAVSLDRGAIMTVLEKSLSQFGDQLYIRHSPILQQEGKLIICGVPEATANPS